MNHEGHEDHEGMESSPAAAPTPAVALAIDSSEGVAAGKLTDSQRIWQRRRQLMDPDVALSGPEKTARIALGLALLHRYCKPGVELTHDDIAAWAGCSVAAIYLIEQRALRKLRVMLGRESFALLYRELRDAKHGRRDATLTRARNTTNHHAQ